LSRMSTALQNYVHVEAPLDLVAMFPPDSAAANSVAAVTPDSLREPGAESAGADAPGAAAAEGSTSPEADEDPAELARIIAEVEADARAEGPPPPETPR